MRNFLITLLFSLVSLAAHHARAQIPATGISDSIAASANVLPITIDAGPANSSINRPFVSITICMPGSSTDCQTIDHVLVDIGSSGLRILSSALELPLPQQTLDGGTALVECMQFLTRVAWGPVKQADVRLAGERANSIPIQIIGDAEFPHVPDNCSDIAPVVNNAQSLRANGLLGVGLFLQDCGMACARTASLGVYYGCLPSGCQAAIAPLEKQVQHPVPFLPANNNGVVIRLPSLPTHGAATLSGGELIFGIGTQENNSLGLATVLTVNPAGHFTTIYKGKANSKAFIDSGSNGIWFFDGEIPVCRTGTYCPSSPLALSATNQGINGAMKAADFHLDNVETLLSVNPDYAVFDGLGFHSTSPGEFNWGLPFFFGKSVFTAIEGKNTPGGTGPYYAY